MPFPHFSCPATGLSTLHPDISKNMIPDYSFLSSVTLHLLSWWMNTISKAHIFSYVSFPLGWLRKMIPPIQKHPQYLLHELHFALHIWTDDHVGNGSCTSSLSLLLLLCFRKQMHKGHCCLICDKFGNAFHFRFFKILVYFPWVCVWCTWMCIHLLVESWGRCHTSSTVTVQFIYWGRVSW